MADEVYKDSLSVPASKTFRQMVDKFNAKLLFSILFPLINLPIPNDSAVTIKLIESVIRHLNIYEIELLKSIRVIIRSRSLKL